MGTRADAEVEGRDGTPVGRRAVLGLLGLGTAGVLVGAKVQDKVAEVMRTPGTGYGIYNICERIELYYGSGSGLFPSITEDGETCFTLKLNRT